MNYFNILSLDLHFLLSIYFYFMFKLFNISRHFANSIVWNFKFPETLLFRFLAFSRYFHNIVEFSHLPKCQVTNIELCTARQRINHNIADIPNYSVNDREQHCPLQVQLNLYVSKKLSTTERLLDPRLV